MAGDGMTLDTKQLDAALKEFSAFLKNDPAEILLDEARLLAIDAMNLTPPFGAGKSKGSTLAAKKQGESAVERSISNSFTPIQATKTENPWLNRLIEQGRSADSLNKFFRKTESEWRVAHFSEDKHESNRNSKGRVFRSRKKLTFETSHAAVARRKAKVGTFKGAWASMATDIGKHRKSKTKARIPKWVSRNMSSGSRMVTGFKIDTSSRLMSVKLGAVSHEYMKFGFNRALSSRARSMRQKLKLILDNKTNKLNKKYNLR